MPKPRARCRRSDRSGRDRWPAPGPAHVSKHGPGDKLSPSGIPIKTVYRPEDAELNYDADLADPGSWPFTRGVQPTMYRGRLWTMRQYAGFGGARSTNERFRMLLDAGQTGLSVAFDLPTQMGLDRSEEHTSELQSLAYLVCRLLLEKKKKPTALAAPTVPHTHTTVRTIG